MDKSTKRFNLAMLAIALIGVLMIVSSLAFKPAQEEKPTSVGELEMVQFHGCLYVLWKRHNAVAMEHHRGCLSTRH